MKKTNGARLIFYSCVWLTFFSIVIHVGNIAQQQMSRWNLHHCSGMAWHLLTCKHFTVLYSEGIALQVCFKCYCSLCWSRIRQYTIIVCKLFYKQVSDKGISSFSFDKEVPGTATNSRQFINSAGRERRAHESTKYLSAWKLRNVFQSWNASSYKHFVSSLKLLQLTSLKVQCSLYVISTKLFI